MDEIAPQYAEQPKTNTKYFIFWIAATIVLAVGIFCFFHYFIGHKTSENSIQSQVATETKEMIENSVCKTPRECTELAIKTRNISICEYITGNSPPPYTLGNCLHKLLSPQ